MLRALPGADPREARLLADRALRESLELRRRYRAVSPPLWHNVLVNTGIRKRGLCWHWADDLWLRLRKLRLRTLRILPVGANVGSYWREHNALAVLPASQPGYPLKRGILLDPWRKSGELWFAPVGKDPRYRWRLRSDRLPDTVRKSMRDGGVGNSANP
jgi:hypothetical protein